MFLDLSLAQFIGAIIAIVVIVVTIVATIVLTDRAPAFPLRGKAAFITGGSSGIGLATARALLSGGCSVAIVGRSMDKLRAAEQELRASGAARHGATVIAISADVCDAAAVHKAVDDAANTLGRLDVLVTSAGISKPGHFMELDLEDFDRLMRANYLGTVYATRACIPHMRRQGGGRVMFVSSMGGQAGVFGFSAYSPSKFAVRGLAEVLQMEFRLHNIFFSVVNPPDTDTPMLAEENLIKPEECRIISEGAGLFTADQVAANMVQAIVRWQFFVHNGFDGFLLARITGGFAPSSGVLFNLFELIFSGLLRYVALGYLAFYRSVVVKCAAKRSANGAASVISEYTPISRPLLGESREFKASQIN